MMIGNFSRAASSDNAGDFDGLRIVACRGTVALTGLAQTAAGFTIKATNTTADRVRRSSRKSLRFAREGLRAGLVLSMTPSRDKRASV